jgi:hypothetical protein
MTDLVLLIKRVGDELEVSVESETPDDSQEKRRDGKARDKDHGRSREIKEQKRHRRQHSGGGGDHADLGAGPHQTMILLEDKKDKVTFKCDRPFTIDVEFDPDYQDFHKPDPRRSPFGWTTPQSSAFDGAKHVVKATYDDDERKDSKGNKIDETRPSDYHFYKMTLWCDDLKMDPDWYCDR